ncbi:hydrogenase formation protein HypD [Fuerstiella marisgermanici]|uniref:Hydrogenase expression/formation protein HypD n=1 Tax=Fuerstiella marisgermanici TaxID=1891926 RepID=A0A1P8WCF1_9PLAN|nr:hydrogenase formation protein HypD [Fuerstiella marisgermanici]APZ91726.1 Hydrogenase expression/formation protein HypD [Fuerstiella marisgermanici]
MKYVDEFRDPQRAKSLIAEIRATATKKWVLMDVCGGQTHSLLRHGIEQELSEHIELIHGPGCPVCVTPAEAIDFAIRLSHRPDTILTSFGDMLRVPGTSDSLLNARTQGGSVKTVYSPIDAVQLAKQQPNQQIVFFAVGFETTVPATALAVLQAAELNLANFSLLVSHVRVQPAMEAILRSPDNRVEAFLGAGHVCTVAGFDSYSDLTSEFQIPIAITGFEPTDLLEGILNCVVQLEAGTFDVHNAYARTAAQQGNLQALEIMDRVYEVTDRPWRGLGTINDGGYVLRNEWCHVDAEEKFADAAIVSTPLPILQDGGDCRAADVLSGRLRPHECSEFGTRCRPDSPLGAPMVSSEGACAAYFRFSPPPRVKTVTSSVETGTL